MLLGEKYPDPVRMVSMGAFSKELCGGTHLTNTREVEKFEILSEEGVSAGTRRITALTGKKAAEHVQQIESAVGEAAKLLGVSALDVADAAVALTNHAREVRKQLSSGGAAAKPPAKKAIGKQDKAPSYEQLKQVLSETGRQLSVAPLAVPQRIAALQGEVASLEKQLAEREAAGPLSG